MSTVTDRVRVGVEVVVMVKVKAYLAKVKDRAIVRNSTRAT